MEKKKPWIEKWATVQDSPFGTAKSGGQGSVQIVQHNSMSDGVVGVLKTLNKPNDPERRARMRREVTSLETCNHTNIPKILDSNSHRFKEPDVTLYFVQDFINGPTLEEHLALGPVDALSAIRCVETLIEVVEYFHRQDIYHRDIKPDNIILRNGEITDPVIVDFGQSFNDLDETTKILTNSALHLGNRFLGLPELQSPSGNRRDPRSDYTQLCGILFYLLTGIIPTVLTDDDGRMPHYRSHAAQVLAEIQGINRINLRIFFDRAFKIRLEERFQSIDEMRTLLLKIPLTGDQEFQLLTEAELTKNREIVSHLLEAHELVLFWRQAAVNDVGQELVPLTSDFYLDRDKMILYNAVGILHAETLRSFWLEYRAEFSGTRVRLFVQQNGINDVVGSWSLHNSIDDTNAGLNLYSTFLTEAEKLVDPV